MAVITPVSEQKRPWIKWVLLLIFLGLLAWSARYWMSAEFGLYEDDLTFIPGVIDSTFGEVLQDVSAQLSTMGHQGRPLMWSWVLLFSYLGWQLGGLQGMYVVAYTIWLSNIILFVLLLRRVNGPFIFSVVGGLTYVLFSADTNQAFLFNVFGLQTAITLLLIALHFYVSRTNIRWLAYLFLFLVIINYETPFWLFLAAPLLTEDKGKSLRKQLIINTAIMVFLFIAIFYIRQVAGDSRVAGLNIQETILTAAKHMAIGPAVSLGIYFLRPFLVFRQATGALMLAVVSSAIAIFGLLYWVLWHEKLTAGMEFPIQKGWWAKLEPQMKRELQLLLAGMIMLVFAYPLTLILRPYAISGRETRVHLAGVVGAALIAASFFSLVIRLIKRQEAKLILIGLVSMIFGLNFAFGFVIQKAYAHAWDLQKQFWQALIPQISDSEDGTAILIDPSGLEDVLYIDANTWNLSRVLLNLYNFNDNWERYPKVFRLTSNWQENIIRVPGYFSIDGNNSVAPPSTYGDYAQNNTIYIATINGKFERQTELPIQDQFILLKQIGEDNFSTFETTSLYELMILED